MDRIHPLHAAVLGAPGECIPDRSSIFSTGLNPCTGYPIPIGDLDLPRMRIGSSGCHIVDPTRVAAAFFHQAANGLRGEKSPSRRVGGQRGGRPSHGEANAREPIFISSLDDKRIGRE